VRQEPELLACVEREGKRWAEVHYSKAVAQRFLRLSNYDALPLVDGLWCNTPMLLRVEHELAANRLAKYGVVLLEIKS
jgi:hypothetical protein